MGNERLPGVWWRGRPRGWLPELHALLLVEVWRCPTLIECPYCDIRKDCRNDLLHHIVRDHDADMSEWPEPSIGDWTNAVHCGDAFDILPRLPAESVHACVTDPPYGLAFMGRDWDDFEPKEYQKWCENWAREVKRVIKPGGHLLAFSGNRTHHRLFTGVEDAGFEVRDTLTWHYGSGFPKGGNLSKNIDRRKGEDGDYGEPKSERAAKQIEYGTDDHKMHEEYQRPWMEDEEAVEQNAREYIPGSEEAQRWKGWRTALKPATEFVVMARKPFDGATVDCVLEHGTGALNIAECRIGDAWSGEVNKSPREGRYPANVVFGEQAAADLDEQVGELSAGTYTAETGEGNVYGERPVPSDPDENISTGDSGGPSRYFYTSKASRSERTLGGTIENAHPTVKPQDLMEWLIKLVSREEQIVLDPFAGSGTTCMAAKELNRRFIAIEMNEGHADIARARAGLTVEDPSHVRPGDGSVGLSDFAAGGAHAPEPAASEDRGDSE